MNNSGLTLAIRFGLERKARIVTLDAVVGPMPCPPPGLVIAAIESKQVA